MCAKDNLRNECTSVALHVVFGRILGKRHRGQNSRDCANNRRPPSIPLDTFGNTKFSCRHVFLFFYFFFLRVVEVLVLTFLSDVSGYAWFCRAVRPQLSGPSSSFARFRTHLVYWQHPSSSIPIVYCIILKIGCWIGKRFDDWFG